MKKGFVQIPNALFYDERLGNEAKVLWCYIKSLSEDYRKLRNSNLCQKLGISTNTLQKAKKQLVEYKYLVITRLSSANKYDIRLPKNRVIRVSKFKQSDYPKFGQYYKGNNNSSNNIINKKGFKGFKK